MKKILALLTVFSTKIALADGDSGILGGDGIDGDKIRKGDIHMNDIPNMIKHAIDYLLGFAGTISIIFIIIGAYQILFGSITSEKTKGRDTIIMALIGFVVASLSWFIIKYIMTNFAI